MEHEDADSMVEESMIATGGIVAEDIMAKFMI